MSAAKEHRVPPSGRFPAIARTVLARTGILAALSAILGFAFNASNPVGVRFGSDNSVVQSPPPALPEASAATNVSPNLASAADARPVVLTPFTPVSSAVTIAVPPPVPAAPAFPPVPTLTDSALHPEPTHWPEVKPLAERGEIVLVDVRPRPVYEAGHIPGAISLPESSPPEAFAAFQQQYPTNNALVLYCSSTSCSMSKRVAERMMREFGYPSVKYMTGGYLEWQRAELTRPKTEGTP